VFSIMIVALTLAAQQFGPRLLHNFMRDRGNQVVLGTFTATFVYSLLVLQLVQKYENANRDAVPELVVPVAIILAMLSLGVLIYFIHHVSTLIQVPELIARVGHDLEATIDHYFPNIILPQSVPDEAHGQRVAPPPDMERQSAAITAPRSGYFQAVEDDTLMELARQFDVILRLKPRPGDFLVRDDDVVLAWPGERLCDELERQVRGALIIGNRRTRIQDIEFAVRELVEIALRALSPAINDPFTAMACIDHLAAGLCRLCRRGFPSRYRLDERGRLRVIIDPFTYQGIVDAAFNQIRQNAAHHVAVYISLLEAIAVVMRHTCNEEQRAALLRQARMIHACACEGFRDEEDRRDLEERFERVLKAMETCRCADEGAARSNPARRGEPAPTHLFKVS
jgi:uncharacterized membrane protein